MAIPEYEDMLAAYHRTFEKEIRHMIGCLPVEKNARVLDAGSGDGFYAGLLASRLGPAGRLECVDVSADYLAMARRRLSRHPRRGITRFHQADIRRLPFPDGHFDFVWCAQSLYSFPEPVRVLKELRRVVRPDGIVAAFENDTIHQVLLPWPPDVELLLRRAELRAFKAKEKHAEKFYVGRNLMGVFQAAGLRPERKRTFCWDRIAPLDAACRTFFRGYLADLRSRVAPYLGPGPRRKCEVYLDPRSSRFLLRRRDLCVTLMDQVLWGRKRRATRLTSVRRARRVVETPRPSRGAAGH